MLNPTYKYVVADIRTKSDKCIRAVTPRIGRKSISEGVADRCKVKIYPAKSLTDSGKVFGRG